MIAAQTSWHDAVLLALYAGVIFGVCAAIAFVAELIERRQRRADDRGDNVKAAMDEWRRR